MFLFPYQMGGYEKNTSEYVVIKPTEELGQVEYLIGSSNGFGKWQKYSHDYRHCHGCL